MIYYYINYEIINFYNSWHETEHFIGAFIRPVVHEQLCLLTEV